MQNAVITVTQLNYLTKEIIEKTDFLRNLAVQGEISNLTFNRSGHIYFSLKDEKATIKCMVWKDKAEIVKRWNLQEGMKITCFGRLTYYIVGGSVNLEVHDISLEGKGELQKLYDERYEDLKVRGWFDQSIKKALPKFPKNIGIVTADTGAVIHDLISTIKRRYPFVNLYLFPTQVQGSQARYDIAKKIQQANAYRVPLDILIVGRGGGSYEDLWPFNEMEVLNAARQSIIPIISAVGHEPDFTLLDYVADKRAATPTAAGELATPNLGELKRTLQLTYQDLINTIEQVLLTRAKWIHQSNRYISQFLNQILTLNVASLKNLYHAFLQQMDLQLALQKNQLENLAIQCNLTNPFNPLTKGYSLLFDQNQKIVENITELTIGQKVNLKTQHGIVEAQVRRVILAESENHNE